MKNRCGTVILVGVLFTACLGFMAKLLIIGEPVAGEQVYCTASANGGQLELQVDAVESAAALWGWKYTLAGSTLYITARKVPVSLFFDDGHYEASLDIEMIEKIVLGGKTIWSCNE